MSDTSRTLVGDYAGRYASGDHMTVVGLAAGMTAPDRHLVAAGFDAARYNSGACWTVVGYGAASHNSGSEGIAIGLGAHKYGAGDCNIAIGNHALCNAVEDDAKTAAVEDERTFLVPAHGYWPGTQHLFHLASTGALPRNTGQELSRLPLKVLDHDRLLLLSTSIASRGDGVLKLRRVATPQHNNIAIGHGVEAVEDDRIQIGTAAHRRFYAPPPVETDASLRARPRARAALPPAAAAKEGAFLYCTDARGEGRPGLVYCDGAHWFSADTHEQVG